MTFAHIAQLVLVIAAYVVISPFWQLEQSGKN